MSPVRTAEYLKSLVRELCRLPNETEWVEFKTNDAEPKKVGEYISALSNSAALVEQPTAYLVWGIRDSDKEIVGTTFKPSSTKIGNENLENWLLRSTRPQIHFTFHSVEIEGLPVVVLEVERATYTPVRFQDDEFIRIGSYKKNCGTTQTTQGGYGNRLTRTRSKAAPPLNESGTARCFAFWTTPHISTFTTFLYRKTAPEYSMHWLPID